MYVQTEYEKYSMFPSPMDFFFHHLFFSSSYQWHAFSMPELKNFLRILQREEEEHIKQIVQRYALARTRMQESLAGSTPG